jgi:hypothetical protein
MSRSWIAIAALIVAGCAPMNWVRPDATPEQLAADTQQCEQEAWREANYYYAGATPFGPWLYRGDPFFHTAGPFFNPYYDRTMEEQRLANFCMRAKGYDLAPVSK